MNSAKKCSEAMDNSKNKLNCELIYNFNPHPNAHLVPVWVQLKRSAFAFQHFFFH